MAGDSVQEHFDNSSRTDQDVKQNPAEHFFLPHISGHITWIWDILGDTVHFSREWHQIVHCPDDDIANGNTNGWWPYMHEEDVIPFCEMARKIAEGTSEHYQTLFRIRRRNGQWAWMFSRGKVIEKKEGKPTRVAGALMDVSELRTDVKFQHGIATAAPGKAMLEYSPDLILRMDERLSPLYLSPHIARSMTRGQGCPPLGEPSLPHGMKPEQVAFLREKIQTVFANGAPLREQVTFATAYGHDVTGEYSFWPEYDEHGTIVAVMTQFRDLTDHILAKQRAKLNEMRLDALHRLTQMDGAPQEELLRFVMDSLIKLTGSEDGFLFFPDSYPGPHGRVVWSEHHYGALDPHWLRDDALAPELLRIIADDNGDARSMMQNGNSLHPVAMLFNGQMEVMRYISAPVFDEGKVVCIAGVYNKATDYQEGDLQQLAAFINGVWLISRRRNFVRELQKAKEAAEHASKIKDMFLANVSHELRTPLNGILSMLQLLSLLPLTEQQRQYVATANASGQTLIRIISDILDFSRIETGKMQLRNEPFDLRHTIESTISHFLPDAEEKGVHISVAIDEEFPPMLVGDAARIRQILFNIVGNALKFTERGTIRIESSPLRIGEDGSVRIYLSVQDTGIGIAQEMQDKIFEAFTQVDSSSTRRYPGVGLGLSIVRRLVGLMGGSIAIDSELGKGTTVHCSFTLAAPSKELSLTTSGADTCESPIPLAQQLDILVAEDDAAGRFALQTFLQRLGHRPVCVPNGRFALEVLRLYPFHCLFTDIQMPDMDGLEVVRRIRDGSLQDIAPSVEARVLLATAIPGAYEELCPVPLHMPVVAVSAHAMSEDKERFLRAGMDFYLSKPLVMVELTQVLKSVAALAKGK